MSEQPPITSINTQEAFGASKEKFESTYKRLFQQFARSVNNFSDNVPDDDKIFIRVAIDEVKSAHIANTILHVGGKSLDDISMDIKANLEILNTAKIQSVKQLHGILSGRFQPLYNDVIDKTNQRKQLQEELKIYLIFMHTQFVAVANAINEGKLPAADIQNMLVEIEKKLAGLDTEILKLDKSEKSLKEQLNILNNESSINAAPFKQPSLAAPAQADQFKKQ